MFRLAAVTLAALFLLAPSGADAASKVQMYSEGANLVIKTKLDDGKVVVDGKDLTAIFTRVDGLKATIATLKAGTTTATSTTATSTTTTVTTTTATSTTATSTTTTLPPVFWAERVVATEGKTTWAQAQAKCATYSRELCAMSQVCPGGKGTKMVGIEYTGIDGWFPVADKTTPADACPENDWAFGVDFPADHGVPSCALHQETPQYTGQCPAWGTAGGWEGDAKGGEMSVKIPCCEPITTTTTTTATTATTITTTTTITTDATPVSAIASNVELDAIKGWMKTDFPQFVGKEVTLELCYSMAAEPAVDNGDKGTYPMGKGQNFQDGCLVAGREATATITVLKSRNGNVMGGATATNFGTTDAARESQVAFLFCLSCQGAIDRGRTQPEQLKLHPENRADPSVPPGGRYDAKCYAHAGQGPCFGGGHDLTIPNNVGHPQSQAYANLGSTYECPVGDVGAECAKYFTYQNANPAPWTHVAPYYTANDYEVFWATPTA